MTWTETPVPVPFSLVIGVYNSAGELVDLIFNGTAQILPATLGIPNQTYATSGGAMQLNLPGFMTQNGIQTSNGISWNLTNSAAQPVQSGIYYIKAEYKDSFGRVTALVQSVQVVNTSTANTLVIYNSAGEAVKHINLSGSVTGFGIPLGNAQFAPVFNSSGANTSGALSITASMAGGGTALYSWDGTNDQGQPLSGGTYNIQLTYASPSGQNTEMVRSVTLIKTAGGVSLAGSTVAPNPVTGGLPYVYVSYPWSPGQECVASVYNLAGERVALATDPMQSGKIQINVESLSGGIYLVDLEKRYGPVVMARCIMKLAIAK
jgi:flagellar hook assembly protein FlgD